MILILEAVVSAGEAPTTSEIAARLSLPTPTVHRLVLQLVDRGLLRRELGSKRVLPGARLVEFGAGIASAAMRPDQIHVILCNLALELGEHCQVEIASDGEVLYLDTARGTKVGGLIIKFERGHRAPLHCTSIGKLYLGSLSDSDLKSWVEGTTLRAYTRNTIVDNAKLTKVVRDIRENGWAWNNEEYVVGVVGCAVPIASNQGKLMAGLGLSAPSVRVEVGNVKELIPRLKKVAARIAASLE